MMAMPMPLPTFIDAEGGLAQGPRRLMFYGRHTRLAC
jgi:hypothetical protein